MKWSLLLNLALVTITSVHCITPVLKFPHHFLWQPHIFHILHMVFSILNNKGWNKIICSPRINHHNDLLFPILSTKLIVFEFVIPITEFNNIFIYSPISSLVSSSSPYPSCSSSSSTHIKILSSFLLHLWFNDHLPSHRKHNPLSRFFRTYLMVSLRESPWLCRSFD